MRGQKRIINIQKPLGSDGVHQYNEQRREPTISVVFMILFWPRLLPVIVGIEEWFKYYYSDEVCCSRTYEIANCVNEFYLILKKKQKQNKTKTKQKKTFQFMTKHHVILCVHAHVVCLLC